MSEKETKSLCFVLTSAMQVVFLSKDTFRTVFGYNPEKDRDLYLENLVSLLYHGKASSYEYNPY